MSETTKTISKSMQRRIKVQSGKSDYKTVLMPIRVPIGNYCWGYKPPHEICEYFGNEGGHPQCRLGFYPLEEEDNGVLKPKECLNFKEEVKS